MGARCGNPVPSGHQRIDEVRDPAEVPLIARGHDAIIGLGNRGNDHIKRAVGLSAAAASMIGALFACLAATSHTAPPRYAR